MYYIYLTTNLINNKKYIGQHKINSTTEKDYYLGSGKLLQQAIKKYGKQNFKKEILEYCDTKEEANLLEQKYIQIYNAVENNNYYNLAIGGDGGGFEYYRDWKKEHPEEAKKHEENRIKAILEWQKTHTEEVSNLGKANIKKCHEWIANNQEIMQSYYKTYGEAGGERLKQWAAEHPEEFKINQQKGTEALKKWAESHPEEVKKNLSLGPQANKEKNGKRVKCLNTGIIFKSYREAEQYYGMSKDAIRKCIKGITKSAGKDPVTKEKLYWELVKEIE